MRIRRLFAAAAVTLALLAGLQLLTGYVNDYLVRVLVLCGINVTLAVALNLINGTAGQFSIGHAGFMAVGAYAAAFTTVHIDGPIGRSLSFAPEWVSGGVVLTIALLVGASFAAATGLLVGIPSLRLKGDYLAIVTLGFGEIIRLFFNNQQWLGGQRGFDGGRPAGLPVLTTPFWAYLWAVVTIVLVRNLTFSSYGRALGAVRDDEIAAEAMGINTTRAKVLAFVVSAAFTGIAGGLYAHLQSAVNPNDFKFDKSVEMVIMVIVGGLGSITGAVLGGLFIGVILEVLRETGSFRLVVYALLLVVMMRFRPQGALGRRELRPAAILAWWRARVAKRAA